MKEVKILKNNCNLLTLDFDNKDFNVIEPVRGIIDYAYCVYEDCIIDGKEVKANSVVFKTYSYGDTEAKLIVASDSKELIDHINDRNRYFEELDNERNLKNCCKKCDNCACCDESSTCECGC